MSWVGSNGSHFCRVFLRGEFADPQGCSGWGQQSHQVGPQVWFAPALSPPPNQIHWSSGSTCVNWICTPLCPLQTHGLLGPQVWMTCTASTPSPNPQSLGSTISFPLQIVHRCELALHPFPPPPPNNPCSNMSTDVICMYMYTQVSYSIFLPLLGPLFLIIVRGSTCVTGPVLSFPSALSTTPPSPQQKKTPKKPTTKNKDIPKYLLSKGFCWQMW